MDNAIGINVKGDLNLRHASGGGWDAHKLKLAQLLVVCSHLTLTLEHLDAHLGLVVGSCAEGLGLLGRDGCVPTHNDCFQTEIMTTHLASGLQLWWCSYTQ